MRGHVRRRGSTWTYVIDLAADPATGRRRQKSRGGFATKKAAEEAMRDATETAQEAYLIEDVHNPGLGDRMCRTGGRSSRTDCGTVIDVDEDGLPTNDLFRVDGQCSIPGDSGGPYFSFHIGYGLHNGGPDCGGTALGQRALEAAARMNVYIVEG